VENKKFKRTMGKNFIEEKAISRGKNLNKELCG
jgi:hypothetical protein